jgi:diguanylate cyclase (GGDEF)-like protein/PAS domain S-box-containing protein
VSEPSRPGADLKAAVEALRHRTQQYRLLAEQTADGVLLATQDGRITDASPNSCRLLAYPRAELLKKRVGNLFVEEDEWDALRRLAATKPRSCRLRARDKRVLEAEMSVRKLGDGRLQIVLKDVTDTRRAAEALRESEERYERLADVFPDAVVIQAEGRIVFTNSAGRRLLGAAAGVLAGGRTLADLAHPEDREALRKKLSEAAASSRRATRVAWRLRRPDGTLLEVEGTATAMAHRGRPAIQVLLRETTAGTSDAWAAEPNRDTRTGLTTSSLVTDRLEVAIAQAYRHRARVGTVLVALDGFRKASEGLGRSSADRLLRAAGRRLSNLVREGDTVSRLDDDTFALVLPGLRHAEDPTTVAEKVLGSLRKPFPIRDRVIQLTASVGVSVFPEDGDDAVSLLRSAEQALAAARAAGGDRYQAPPGPPARAGVDPLELEVGLRAALGRGQMAINGMPAQPGTLYYQPFYSLSTGRVCGVEALLRWQHPHLGIVFPQDFLSKADFAGLILAIGPWILRTACLQARTWQRRYRGLRLAINLSPPEMLRHDLAEQVRGALDESGLPPRLLQVEVQESHVMRDLPRWKSALTRLKELGVSIVLDRFGVGYSSLSQLAEVPMDAVKLDLAFPRSATSHPDDASLLIAVVAVARSLKLKVLAQGVETEAQLAMLRRLSCEEAQGFLLSPPAPATACEALLGSRAFAPKVERPVAKREELR